MDTTSSQLEAQIVQRFDKPNYKKWIILIAFFCCIAVFIALLIYNQRPFQENTIQTVTTSGPTSVLMPTTPTLMPFIEMTIPFLRQKTYVSSLSSLDTFSENPSFTSYLTSYNSDELTINGLLTQPKGDAPPGGWPAIIFIHGYIPPQQYRTTQNYASYVNYLARNGFVVFKIDLRGHDKSEGEPGGSYFSSDYIIDVLNARAALQKSGFVNPDKIGLWGHSMAGNVSLRAFAVQPKIPAVVIWSGAVYSYSDRLRYGIDDGSYLPPPVSTKRQQKRQLLRDIHGEFDPSKPFWQQVAATNYLNDLQGAIQLHHTIDDSVVNIDYSRDLIDLLDKTSVPHEIREYQTGGHNISGVSFTQAMEKTVEFYKKNLGH